MSVLGLDEAGRGCAVGPLIMVGVLTEWQTSYFTNLGVDDSKALAPEKRLHLAEEIKRLTPYHIVEASASKVDEYVERGGLNVLERMMAEQIICSFMGICANPDIIILDGHNLFDSLKERLEKSWMAGWPPSKIVVKNKADAYYQTVGAASIVAKETRDAKVKEIMGEHFNNGAGYCNQGTADWINHHGFMDPEDQKDLRTSFKWTKKILETK